MYNHLIKRSLRNESILTKYITQTVVNVNYLVTESLDDKNDACL